MGIAWRLIILILLAAVPVFVIQIAHDIDAQHSRKADVLTTAETLAGLIAAREDRIVEGARLLLITAAHLQSVREKDAATCNERLREIAELVPELTAIAVLSPEGERWCASLPVGGPMNLADRKYFQATIRTGALQSSDYIIGRQTGEGSITFTYPAVGPDGKLEAVLFVAYRTSVLSRMLNEPPLPEGAKVALIGSDGVIAAAWPDPETWMGRNLMPHRIVQHALLQRRGAMADEAPWIGPGEYAFGFAPMRPPTSLTVLVGLPVEHALRDAERLLWRQVAWTTLVFLLAALVALAGGHFMLVRPLRALRTSVNAFARGDFQAEAPAGVRGSPELRVLAEQFEAMGRALAQREALLFDALRQKEMLLKEVNHRVKNSLQLVASLLALQRARIEDPEARRQFDQAARRINTVAQIHQRLYRDENVDRVSLDVFLLELCGELNQAMGEDGKLTVTCQADHCHLPTEQVVPLALIVNELVTNAFKYSYPGGSGTIRVECRAQAQALTVSVSDDGNSLPDSFDPAASGGLGMRMVNALARQIGATLQVVPHGQGKSFVLHVPLAVS